VWATCQGGGLAPEGVFFVEQDHARADDAARYAAARVRPGRGARCADVVHKIALAPTSLPNAAPLEFIDAAAQAGFDGIGLRLFRSPGIIYPFFPVAGNAALARDVKQALASCGLQVIDILSFYLQPETDVASMLPALELGAELGATYALVIGDDPDWQRQVDTFGKICDAAARFGLVISVEAPVTQRQVNTLPKALQLIANSGRPNAVICLDPFHFFRVGHSVDLLRRQDKRLFPYSQIDDGLDEVPAPGGRCAPGEGMVPLAGILDALPPDVPLSMEWSAPRGSRYSSAEWAMIALRATRRYLDGYYATHAERGAS
jgi:sugar phosphate isomerase/epimerase